MLRRAHARACGASFRCRTIRSTCHLFVIIMPRIVKWVPGVIGGSTGAGGVPQISVRPVRRWTFFWLLCKKGKFSTAGCGIAGDLAAWWGCSGCFDVPYFCIDENWDQLWLVFKRRYWAREHYFETLLFKCHNILVGWHIVKVFSIMPADVVDCKPYRHLGGVSTSAPIFFLIQRYLSFRIKVTCSYMGALMIYGGQPFW